MKKIISILFIAVLVTACGGGGSVAAPPGSGSGPSGIISSQVDPVQST